MSGRQPEAVALRRLASAQPDFDAALAALLAWDVAQDGGVLEIV